MVAQPRAFVARVSGAVNLTGQTLSPTDILQVDTVDVRSAQATLRTIGSFLPSVVGMITALQYGAVGDGVTDDTAALQAALNAAAGKSLWLGSGLTFKVTSSLFIKGHRTTVLGGNCIINYSGSGAAIDFALVGGAYNGESIICDLEVFTTAPGSIGFRIACSYGAFTNLIATLRPGATGAVGFLFPGDAAGNGPYYNMFQHCTVQSQDTNQTGISMTVAGEFLHAPNANTWIGGRIGQCATGIDIKGAGNDFISVTMEGNGTAVLFDSTVCNFIGGYIEGATVGFAFSAASEGNGVMSPYRTGVATLISDSGTRNWWVIPNEVAAQLPKGVKFGAAQTTLQNYLEGSWTPTLAGSGTSGDYTLTLTDAKYTRIGNMVTASAAFAITVNAPGTGDATFGGLPFPTANGQRAVGTAAAASLTIPAGVVGLCVREQTGSGSASFFLAGSRTGAGVYFFQCSDIITGTTVVLTFSYFTDVG